MERSCGRPLEFCRVYRLISSCHIDTGEVSVEDVEVPGHTVMIAETVHRENILFSQTRSLPQETLSQDYFLIGPGFQSPENVIVQKVEVLRTFAAMDPAWKEQSSYHPLE